MTVRSRTSAIMAATAMLLGAGMTSLHAESRTVGFTTYLRDGPGMQFRPVEEALSGREAEILGCDSGWCRIRIGRLAGYVQEGTLVTAPPPSTSGPQTCFLNRQAGYRRGRDLQICRDGAPKP